MKKQFVLKHVNTLKTAVYIQCSNVILPASFIFKSTMALVYARWKYIKGLLIEMLSNIFFLHDVYWQYLHVQCTYTSQCKSVISTKHIIDAFTVLRDITYECLNTSTSKTMTIYGRIYCYYRHRNNDKLAHSLLNCIYHFIANYKNSIISVNIS